MFAKIKTTKNLGEAFEYNEQKLQGGTAECLLAENYLPDLKNLSIRDKLDRFEKRNALNERVRSNVIRISLNFGVGDVISNEQMQVLAKRYMTGVGMDRQPYLGYRHYDTAHPHLHLISTPIEADGNRIKAGRAFLFQSAQVTSLLEEEYSLSRNKKATVLDEEQFKTSHAQRVVHGEKSLRKSISNVLYAVIDHYKYTNLEELNAILRLYNVKADPGSATSRLQQFRGLLYHAIDENGKRMGKSIKASAFLLKPTLLNLEQRFALNESLQQQHRQRVTTALDWTLAGDPPDWAKFREALEEEGISVVVQADKKGGPEGIFFVDYGSKSVFAGESLGRGYGLEAIRAQCAQERLEVEEQETLRHHHHLHL